MTDLVERYVQQVGRYVSQNERTEIEAELRSQIQDQLEDRYGGNPKEAEVASVLKELGAPRQMAASYGSDQYLVGPDLYPFMMTILRYGWLLVPVIVVFLNVFTTLASSDEATVLGLLLETAFAALQATFIFSGVVVLIFAVIQYAGAELGVQEAAFDPLALPEVDDPSVVDRFEAAFGIAFGTFFTLVLVYFLRVGGLTLRFNLDDPGDVIPFPTHWMLLLIVAVVGQIIVQLLVLRRNRWNVGSWLAQTLLEVSGAVGLYFAVMRPLFERVMADNPDLADLIFIENGAEFIVIGYVVVALVSKGILLFRLWSYEHRRTPPVAILTGEE